MNNTIFKGFFKQSISTLRKDTSSLYNRIQKSRSKLSCKPGRNDSYNYSYKSSYNFGLRKKLFSIFLSSVSLSLTSIAHAALVDINELHYDNVGADISEGIELVGLSGTSLVDWSLAFYNGNDGKVYKTIAIDETLTSNSAQEQIGFLHIPVSGLQNGPADGVALIDALGNTLRFLSYEGAIIASNGPASGLTSTDIVSSETGTGAIGLSLQRVGDILWDGSTLSFSEQSWESTLSSWGSINPNQSINIVDPTLNPVPVPPSALLFASAIGATALTRRRRKPNNNFA